MSKGGIFVISGPSGSGKDTVLKEVFKKCPEIKFSISSITRPMRVGETEGEKYNFISRDAFEKMIEEDALLEYNCYVGNYYGTPKAPVVAAAEQGADIIIEVDVNGAANIRKKLPEVISIFIMPPSFEELRRRLSGRGTETEEIINERMENALREIKCAENYDFIVVNDNLAEAVDDVISVIKSNSLKKLNQMNIIEEVLKNVKS